MLLSYRLRSPERRGFETRVAASDDGIAFTDLWRATKDELNAESMERAAIVALRDRIRLYLSYVDRGDRRWRIGLIEADRVEGLDPRACRAILSGDDASAAGVKDPVVLRHAERWCMLASVTRGVTDDPDLHAQADAFSSGRLRSLTGLATSADGIRWSWEGVVLDPPREAWDGFEARIATVVRDGDRFAALYDGASGLEENYEERTGIAVSQDLRRWSRETASGPVLESPEGTGALRYTSALRTRDRVFYYNEASRGDRAHELRVARRDAVSGPVRAA